VWTLIFDFEYLSSGKIIAIESDTISDINTSVDPMPCPNFY
jgi:hypothetical protein